MHEALPGEKDRASRGRLYYCLYENTLGRLSEWTAGGQRTGEDDFAARVAREYGDFVPTRPWFEFPFGARFTELWATNDLFGPHFIRKCERKFFLSLEYGIKTPYAAIIRGASHSVYGVADTEVYASAHDIGAKSLDRPGVRRVEQLGERQWIFTVPHYAPWEWAYDLAAGRPLFSMAQLTGSATKRVAVQVPVKSLGAVLREIDAKGLRVEHLFDY